MNKLLIIMIGMFCFFLVGVIFLNVIQNDDSRYIDCSLEGIENRVLSLGEDYSPEERRAIALKIQEGELCNG